VSGFVLVHGDSLSPADDRAQTRTFPLPDPPHLVLAFSLEGPLLVVPSWWSEIGCPLASSFTFVGNFRRISFFVPGTVEAHTSLLFLRPANIHKDKFHPPSTFSVSGRAHVLEGPAKMGPIFSLALPPSWLEVVTIFCSRFCSQLLGVLRCFGL